MVRDADISSKTQVKSTLQIHQQGSSMYCSTILSMSFLLGMISFGILIWQRSKGMASNIGPQSFNSVIFPDSAIPPASYSIQFGGLTPLVLSSAVAYQSGTSAIGLLGCWSLWSATGVNAQALPAVID